MKTTLFFIMTIFFSLNVQASLTGGEGEGMREWYDQCGREYSNDGLGDSFCRVAASFSTTTSSLTYLVGDLDEDMATGLYEECVISKIDSARMDRLENFLVETKKDFSAQELCDAMLQ